jgi:RNA polymerase sigma-70 factor (ECF subfamily)
MGAPITLTTARSRNGAGMLWRVPVARSLTRPFARPFAGPLSAFWGFGVVSRDPESLVARVQAGEEGAAGELFQRYSRGVAMILRHSFGRGGVATEAEDLLQEVFYLAIRKIRGGELRDGRRLPQFLGALARNLSVNHFRKEQRRRTEPDTDALMQQPATTPSQFERVARGERAALVRETLAEMRNPRDREILFRFYIAEEEKDQICRSLDLSSLHFNRVLFRAKQRFRDLLERSVG